MRELNILGPLSALIILVSTLVQTAAFAGDAAYPEALGFSADGSRFAFAEWGQQDGSGFSYASVFIIDLESDSWLAAPVHEFIRDETASPRSAHAKALKIAEPQLAQADITHPARLAFARSHITPQGGEATHTFFWQPIAMLHGGEARHQVMLKPFELSSANCGETSFGFALIWDGREIYRDRSLSKSRGCPTLYSVERIYMPDSIFRAKFGVALIGVYRWGFEGPDLRHIAVPIPLH